jgi:hypothetical protein
VFVRELTNWNADPFCVVLVVTLEIEERREDKSGDVLYACRPEG